MRILIQHTILFSILITGIIQMCLAFAVFLESRRRPEDRYLLAVAAVFALPALANMTDVVARMILSQGFVDLGAAAAGLPSKLHLIGTAILSCTVAFLYLSGRARTAFLSVVAGIVLLSVFLWGNVISRQVFGIHIPVNDIGALVAGYGGLLFMNLMVAVLTGLAWRRGRKNGDADGGDPYVFWSNVLKIVMGITVALLLKFDFESGTPLVYLLLTSSAILLYLGLVAKRHPNPTIRRKPWEMVRGRIAVRMMALTGVFFTILAFCLMLLVANRLIGQLQDEHRSHISHALRIIDRSIALQHDSLSRNAAALSDDGCFADMLSDFRTGNVPTAHKTDSPSRIALTDTRGQVVFLETGPDGSTYGLPEEDIRSLALSGRPNVRLAADPNALGPIDVVMTVAAPVHNGHSQITGILYLSEPLHVDIADACLYGGQMPLSGCGWISFPDRRIILDRHHENDPAGLDDGLTDMIRRGLSFHQPDGDSRRLYANVPEPGAPGAAFAIVSQADMDTAVLRLLSLLAVWTMIFLLAMVYILFRIVETPLRPLKRLQEEAESLEAGLEPTPLEVAYPDEIGRLSDTFNRMAEAIKSRTAQLNRKVQEQRDFIAFTVHELKTPLSAFRWALESIDTDRGEMTSQQKELTTMLKEASDKMRNLVNDLMSVSRLERGKIEIGLQKLAFTEMVRQSAASLSPLAASRDVTIHCDAADAEGTEVIGDEKLLRHVLDNYFSNAVKYSRKNGAVSVRISREDDGQSVRVAVRDRGIGIPPEERERIFSMFFRASNAKESDIEGSGLGLNIARRFVEMHGGRVWFESEEGQGSTFYFQIPVSGPTQDSQSQTPAEPNGHPGGDPSPAS